MAEKETNLGIDISAYNHEKFRVESMLDKIKTTADTIVERMDSNLNKKID